MGTENILARCRDYLQKAKEYASDAEMETILQLDSELTSEIETIANDPSIRQKHERARKINKGCLIGLAVFFGVLFLIWLIAASLGI